MISFVLLFLEGAGERQNVKCARVCGVRGSSDVWRYTKCFARADVFVGGNAKVCIKVRRVTSVNRLQPTAKQRRSKVLPVRPISFCVSDARAVSVDVQKTKCKAGLSKVTLVFVAVRPCSGRWRKSSEVK